MDARIAKWRRWLDDRIQAEVVTKHLLRHTFDGMRRIVRANSALPRSYLWTYLGNTYFETQAVAIRRQAEMKDDRVSSLGRLIHEIEGNPDRITRDFFVAMWASEDDADMGRRRFDREFGGTVIHHFDPEIARNDLGELSRTADHIKAFVDQHLAHSDARASASDLPTFEELDLAIELVGRLYRKYAELLTATSHGLLPPISDAWDAVFRQPWVAD